MNGRERNMPGPELAASPESERTGGAWPWVVLWLVLLGLWAVAARRYYVNHDALWFLRMASAMVDGAVLYRDISDTNPPLIVILSIPPFWIRELSGVSTPTAFRIWVCSLALIALASVLMLLRTAWSDAPRSTRLLLASGLCFCSFPLTGIEFGQREHLATLLLAPWLFASAAQAAGYGIRPGAASACALAAGVGLSLKPHLLLAWPAVELALGLARGWRFLRRPDAFVIPAFVAAYGAAILALWPQYLEQLRVVAALYGGLNPPVLQLLRLPDLVVWLLGLIAFFLLRLEPTDVRRLGIFLAAGLGLLAGGLAQRKGWPYHMYPSRVAGVLYWTALLCALVDTTPALIGRLRGGRRAINAVVAAVLVLASGRYALEAYRRDLVDVITPLRRLVEREPPAGPLFVLGMLLVPGVPLAVYTERPWSSRYNSLWFLPGLYVDELNAPGGEFRFRPPSDMPPLERRLFDELIDDLCARPPRVLIVESVTHQGPAGRRPFDLLTYYNQSRRFEILLRHYQPIARVGAFTVYRGGEARGCQASP